MIKEDIQRANKIAQYISEHEGVLYYELKRRVFNDENIDPRIIMAQINREMGVGIFIQDTEGRLSLLQTGVDILKNGGFEKYLFKTNNFLPNQIIIKGNNNENILSAGNHSSLSLIRPNIDKRKAVKIVGKNINQVGTGPKRRNSIKSFINNKMVVEIIGGLIIAALSYFMIRYFNIYFK